MLENLAFTTDFAIVIRITDKNLAAIHIAVLASLTNFTEFSHKFYTFRLIDAYGIFIPQMVLGSASLAIALYMSKSFMALNDEPLESWHVTEEALRRTSASCASKSSKTSVNESDWEIQSSVSSKWSKIKDT